MFFYKNINNKINAQLVEIHLQFSIPMWNLELMCRELFI